MNLLIYLFIFLLGASFGSFLNAWIWRTRGKKSIMKGRSKCTNCGAEIAWHDNIPVFSYFFLRGRCRHCNKRISIQYPLVELVIGLLFLIVLYHHQNTIKIELIRDLLIIYFLAFIYIYDFKYREILDRITLPLIVILSIFSLVFNWHSVPNLFIGAAIGGGFFILQYLLSKGRWIGGGDIRLGILMGVILGPRLVVLAIFLAYMIGAVVSLILILLKRKKISDSTSFGTYLTLATVVVMLWGKDILSWYLSFLGIY